jgi:diguanylate cyclase
VTHRLALTHLWQAAYRRVTPHLAHEVAGIVSQHKDVLATAFFDWGEGTPGVERPPVPDRPQLVRASQRWMEFALDLANRTNPVPTVVMHRHFGELLADAGIAFSDLTGAFRRYRSAVHSRLVAALRDPVDALAALRYFDEVTDLALSEVHVAHEAVVHPPPQPQAQTDAAAPQQVLDAERQAQLGVLSDEENRYLRLMLDRLPGSDMRPLGASPFGVWLNQRAPLLFEGGREGDELFRIAQTLTHLDSQVLPQLEETLPHSSGPQDRQGPLIREILSDIDEIRRLVNSLFDRLVQADGYRDALTQLFSRPFLPTVLRREIELARRRRSQFSVLLVDIDNFRSIHEHHGPQVGDQVLQQVAELLSNQVRATDFVFRYSGEEFLILLVELDPDHSVAVAEKIRRKMQETRLALHGDVQLQLTLSMGVAPFDGDPDPLRLTQRADTALLEAKASGTNRIGVAPV